jgi:hypothetical protein
LAHMYAPFISEVVTMRFDFGLKENVNTVSAIELKQLLILLASTTTCFRFRIVGEMWVRNLMRVITVNEKTALLLDETENKYFALRINNVMQFELDTRFQNFQPYFHYSVTPSKELE